jgi:uncharacterized protein with von Willebrand factor type A (vWA) domain
VTELRVRVRLPTEHIDAAAALRHTAIEDRAAVRAALAATLVKKSDPLPAFSTVFDLYFAGRRRDLSSPEMSEVDFSGDGAAGNGEHGAGGVLAGLSDDDLAEMLYRALRDGDRLIMRGVAAQLVTRHAGIESGRRVAGIYYLMKALRAANLEAILDRLREEGSTPGGSALDDRLAAQEYASRLEGFHQVVEIRERLVADRGPDDVARTLRPARGPRLPHRDR